MTTRTLWNWEAAAREGTEPERVGRRPHPLRARVRARRLVAEEWHLQGHGVGWRKIVEALGRRESELGKVPVRLVQESLHALKWAWGRLERETLVEARTSHDVLLRDAIWGEDAAYVGRSAGGRVEVEVIRDPASGRTIRLHVGPPATEDAVIAHLEATAAERGGYPLVHQTDRGGSYRGGRLARFHAEKRILPLFSRPRTPTDNAHTERGIEDLREESGIDGHGKDVDVEEAREALETARRRLDEHRRLARHGYRRAVDVDAALARADAVVDRERFYQEGMAAMARAHEAAVAAGKRARDVWRAEREAAFAVMERFRLLGVRRGPLAARAGAPESARTAAEETSCGSPPTGRLAPGACGEAASTQRGLSKDIRGVPRPAAGAADGSTHVASRTTCAARWPGVHGVWRGPRPPTTDWRTRPPEHIRRLLAELLASLGVRAGDGRGVGTDRSDGRGRSPGGCAGDARSLCSG